MIQGHPPITLNSRRNGSLPSSTSSEPRRSRALPRRMQARGPLAVRLAKRAMDLSENLSIPDGLYLEVLSQGAALGSADKAEGMSAFLEKRKAKFTWA